MNRIGKLIIATVVALGAGNVAAYADGCSGRDHNDATALGAVGGGLIGGLGTKSVTGGVAGAVVVGLAVNAIARSNDCNRAAPHQQRQRYSYRDRNGRIHYGYR